MKNILLIAVLLSTIATTSHAAEGRHTAAVGGFMAGILTTLVVQHAMDHKAEKKAEPVAEQPVVVEKTVVVERVVVVEQPKVKKYILIDGKLYELVESR
jgi:hypothetical protein